MLCDVKMEYVDRMSVVVVRDGGSSAADFTNDDGSSSTVSPPAIQTSIVTTIPSLSSTTPSGLMLALSVAQWIVCVVGTAGNVFVLTVLIWRRSPNQRVTQLFVASLSAADLGMTLGSGWVQALIYVDSDWKFGRAFCKFQYSFHVVMINCSIWMLAVLSMDRFLGLKKPLTGSVISLKWTAIMIVIIWVCNVLINIPLTVWTELVVDPSTGSRMCFVVTDPRSMAVYMNVVRIVNYIIPLAIIWISYIGIIIKSKLAFSKVLGRGSLALAQVKATCAGSRRVTLMCLMVVLVFTLTTLPLQLDLFIFAHSRDPLTIAAAAGAIQPLGLVTMLNACVDPIIYGVMWRPFRKSIAELASRFTFTCSCCTDDTTNASSSGRT